MREILITKPAECPFNQSNNSCILHFMSNDIPAVSNCTQTFPKDCPLFTHDYLIQRRSKDESHATKQSKD